MGLTLVLGAGYFVVNASEKKAEHTDNKTEKVVTAPNFLVNKGTHFDPRTSVDIPENCFDPSEKYCVYLPTEAGMTNIPTKSSYTESEIDSYVSAGWLVRHPSSGLAEYTN